MAHTATNDRRSYLFHNAKLFDPRRDELVDGVELLVEEDRIKAVSRPDGDIRDRLRADSAVKIDLRGKTLMPGLIDAHVHIFITNLPLQALESMPLTLVAISAAALMRRMLMRGFTSVRDTAGGDFGMKAACDAGLIEAPRLFIAGMAMSQTGGHGDFRRRTQGIVDCPCRAGLHSLARVVDGVPEMVKAVRDELRKGADHIKLMVSGGVASPHDPLESLQFRVDEIEAACQEATNWGKYVCAHAYSAEAVTRAVRAGVRSIEHGNMIDESTAQVMAEHQAFLVPTLVTYDTINRHAAKIGLPPKSREANDVVRKAGLRSLEIARRAGVEIGLGTDLLGELHEEQSREFLIRQEVERPVEILRSATLINARILRRERELGELVPGALADLLVVDGDPLRDLALLQDQGKHMPVIMKGGKLFKNLPLE
ncbi:MAG TPA: amidohydrolase family protein [Candidatus Binataceae bacterium]|nr:amidohydrolase family protein [Candidatus Binataceae bacterium]